MTSRSLEAIAEKQLVFIAGKGGVGKSTVSTMLALRAQEQGKRVLLALCATRERVSTMLGCAPLDDSIRTVSPGLDVVNMSPDAAIREYAKIFLARGAMADAVFNNRYVSAFLHAVPGIDPWSMLGKAWYHADVPGPDGKKQYDTVIVDAPATGHGLEMLRVPFVIMRAARTGLFRDHAAQAVSLITDRKRAAIVLVTLPQELPTTETLELNTRLIGELGITPNAFVVNQRTQRLFEEGDIRPLEQAALSKDSVVQTSIRIALGRANEEARETAHLKRLASATIPVVAVPRIDFASTNTSQRALLRTLTEQATDVS